MAKNKFSLDFEGFLDLARQIDELGEGYLKQATENALTKSKKYVNGQVMEALETSPYNFKGTGRSHGTTRKSAEEVAKKPLEWEGTTAIIGVGVDWHLSPEATILAYGTPHIKGDTKLRNAIKVKGKVRKEVSRIQQEEFMKVLKEAQNG